MSARPLAVYEPDDDHMVATRRAATMLKLVPALPEPRQVVEFVPEPITFRAWRLQAVAPVRYAACLAAYAHRHAVVPAAVVVAAPIAAPSASPAPAASDQLVSFNVHTAPALPAAPCTSTAPALPAAAFNSAAIAMPDAVASAIALVAAMAPATSAAAAAPAAPVTSGLTFPGTTQPIPVVVDMDDDESVLSIGEDAVVVDIAGMAVALHAPELPLIERELDVVEYTRAVVAAAFAEVAA